ncbi:MAG: hypothetical protein L0H83_05575 [Salinisphaera sp.]|nr:hypothetical protein [Salinisphaera sp.]
MTARTVVFLITLLCASSALACLPASTQYANSNVETDPSASVAHSKTQAVAAAPQDDAGSLIVALPEASTNVPYEMIWGNSYFAEDHQTWNVFELGLKPNPASRPEIVPITLFDTAYGMRGFMQHRWITQHFGLSAGLGLDLNGTSRLNLEKFNLADMREELLFGMGFLLAF